MDYLELFAIAPLTCLTIFSLIVFAVEALMKRSEKASFIISIVGLLLTMVISLVTIDLTGTVFNGMITFGGSGNLFGALFAASALLTIVLSRSYLQKEHIQYGEFYLLVLFSTLGMILMAAAADLMIVFLGLELMSICLYVLVGFMRKRLESNESSVKYFLLGAFATGFLLYGIALLYGAAGTTNIVYIVKNFSVLSSSAVFWIGSGLLLIGFAFKIGAVPFHMWVPDVYQGSPTTIAGFMSTGAKAAAFSAFVLVFAHQFEHAERLRAALAALSAATMILGNIVAISQSNIKRMLAYSSVAHAGYMLAGLAAGNEMGRNGIIFYLITYTFMNIGAFGVLALLEREGGKNLTFDDYAGLGGRKPFLAALMSIFMFSLAGIPPFAGFLGKYYVFAAAIKADLTWLAIVGVLTSAVSVYYYLRLVMKMYFQDGQMEILEPLPKSSFAVLSLAALAVIVIGVLPSSILTLINNLF